MRSRSSWRRLLVTAAVMTVAVTIHASLSSAQETFRFDSAMVPMSDGVRLATDIYLPPERGAYPVVLMRTPYSARRRSWLGQGLTPHGYVVVAQNVRGQNGSEGQFVPFLNEQSDGLATVEWVLKQPWCNGRIGLWGTSYHGFTAYETARTGHPAVQSMFEISSWSDLGPFLNPGGAFHLMAHLRWFYSYASGQPDPPQEAWAQIFRTVPIGKFFQGAEGISAMAAAPYDYASINIPIMHVTGWYDYIYPNVLQTHRALVSLPNGPEQRLIVGPWSHNGILNSWTKVGDEEFGEQAAAGMDWALQQMVTWFDHTLKGDTSSEWESQSVRYFVMNDNRWLEDESWPPSGVEYQTWYLGADGTLAREESAEAGLLQFVYDPDDPVPTVGGANSHFFPENLGPKNQAGIGERADVLVFTSEPLARDMTIAGPISAVVYASTSGKDTDFTAKLSVVRPDGYVRNIEDGIARGRYIYPGTDSTGYLTPGKVYKFTIDCGATALAVKAGERLQVEISSSNFPKYDRNPNTGADPFYATDFVPANQAVRFSSEYPTRIVIPVLR